MINSTNTQNLSNLVYDFIINDSVLEAVQPSKHQQQHLQSYPKHIKLKDIFQKDGDIYYTIENERFPMAHVVKNNGTHLSEEFSLSQITTNNN